MLVVFRQSAAEHSTAFIGKLQYEANTQPAGSVTT